MRLGPGVPSTLGCMLTDEVLMAPGRGRTLASCPGVLMTICPACRILARSASSLSKAVMLRPLAAESATAAACMQNSE